MGVSNLMLTTTLQDGCLLLLCPFIEEESEAQRGQMKGMVL